VIVELRPGGGEEVTLYVKGFLGRGESPEHFDRWLASHDALAESHRWAGRVLGYAWPSGRWLPKPVAALGAAKAAVDLARVLRRLRRARALQGIGLLVGEELALLAAHFVRQYYEAASSARERAGQQAVHLRELAARHRRVRVVAHSLGCRAVIEAVARLAPEERPHEIHLCAPACRERDVAEKLDSLARERTYLYFARTDRVLDLAFTPLARGRALGLVGPGRDYAGLVPVDAARAFDFWVHGEYKNRLSRLVPPR
jgi:hypothetical protein